MKISFRVSARKLIAIELIVAAVSFVIGSLLPLAREEVFIITGFCIAHPLIHAPIGFYKGFDVIMYDADPESGITFYYALSIAIAMVIGIWLIDTLLLLSDNLRGMVGF